jgi:hypothetical protein
MANDVFLTLPRPALDVIGWENDASISGSVTLTLPLPLANTGNLAGVVIALPSRTLAIQGATGVAGSAALKIASSLSVSGVTGGSGSVTLAFPKPVLVAQNLDATRIALPIPTLSLVGTTGAIGSVVQRWPTPALSIVGNVPFVANVALNARLQLAVTGATGSVGSVGTTLRALALAASGYTGAVGTVGLTLPMYGLSAAGTGPLLGTVTLSIPMLVLEATGTTDGAGTSQAFALNVQSQALSTYANYSFNSMTKFNGVYLGASSTGIFALTGATDAGTAIDAVARVGISDYGTAKLKRIDRAYLGYRADGDMVLSVITDDQQRRDYAVHTLNLPGIHGNHVRIGKGVQARYWQFEISNVNGANFELNCLEVRPSRLGRRVGGNEG